jgi:hypothetical protein
MIIAWSLLFYVGYNVLTVEATEKEDKKVCTSYGGEWKETIRVDVSGNEKGSGDNQCQFDNDKDLQLYSIRPGKSLDGTGSDAEYGRLDLGISDEEAAAQEDAICDDEDAGTTNVKLCMSDKRELEQRDKKLENICNKVDGEWTKEGCDVGGGDTPKADKFNELVDKEPGATIIDPESGGVIPFQTPEEQTK